MGRVSVTLLVTALWIFSRREFLQRYETVRSDIDSLLSRADSRACVFIVFFKMAFRSFSLDSKIREPLSVDLMKHYSDTPPSSPKSKGMSYF